MNSGPFWLAHINTNSVSISLVTYEQSYQIASTGPEVAFSPLSGNFAKSVDMSLSTAAEDASLSPDSEPDTIALVIPPEWIGNDGKITPDKLKLFEDLFKEMKLRPMGFISYDEAIAEANNQTEGYLSSLILIHFQPKVMHVSLIYLGKIVERISKNFSDPFDSTVLEAALLELKSESALPPQVLIIGDFTESVLNSIKSHPWVGRKDVETFLHFPEIKSYSQSELINIFLQTVTSQFESPPPLSPPPTTSKIEVVPEPQSTRPELIEVDAGDVGFGPVDANFIPANQVPDQINIEPPVIPKVPLHYSKTRFNLKFPKIKLHSPSLPSIHIKTFFWPLMFSPLLILIPFFYSKCEVLLYLTPYDFQKTLPVTFDSTITEVDLKKGIFPINSQTKELSTSVSVPATGQKTIGDRSTGEITIFNKLDKTINLSKGAVVFDPTGRKFELETAVQIASSSSNLSLGIINLGQTKAMVKAVDIGPESNLDKDTILKIKDYPDTSAIDKAN